LIRQVTPIRIEFLDQFNLPGPPPALHGMFPCAGFENGLKSFEIDELIDTILSGETGDEFGFMLGDAAREVIRDTNVKRAVSFACEDVDEKRCVHAALPGQA
jgi:hypothetical protein